MSSEKPRNRSFSTYCGKRTAYCRDKDLPRLTGLWPSEINTTGIKNRERIVAILRNALRLERQRGKSGHWCYDINRHLTLKQALAQEVIALGEIAEREKKLLRLKAVAKRGEGKISQGSRDGIAVQVTSSHAVLFLALPTASSS